MKCLVVRGLVGFLLSLFVLCCVFQTEGHSKQGSLSVKCTTKTNRCCKLGRKAARHHLISPFYTCHYEALIAGLDHQSSVANRMRLAYRGRLKYTKTIVRTTAFRARLGSCFLPRNKKCFESCCATKREAMIKAAKHAATKHLSTTPTTKHVGSAVTPSKRMPATNITETPNI